MFLKASHRKSQRQSAICFFCRVAAIVQLESYREEGPDRGMGPLRVKDYDTFTWHNCEKMSADVFWSNQHHMLVRLLPPLNTKTKLIESIFH